MKNYLLFFAVVLLLNACKGQPLTFLKEDSIKELTFLRQTDTFKGKDKNELAYGRSYVINTKMNAPEIDTLIGRFVRSEIVNIKDTFDQIILTFYKESDITNETHLKENPRDLDRYSQNNDMIWSFNWEKKSNHIYSYKYKNGEIIYPKYDIKVEDIKYK